ncbi:MAG: excinuclease ABC subunit UvrC [Gracilibacteraceae bacterium]|jgi:excinuclease ABC subunit C|nr:excinuclease ABC subunit UvrC [Gracilibacteraceae bacterium]
MEPLISEKLSLLPARPGVYLMKNASGAILYIGKAKSLKNRVRSYFTGSHDAKTQALVARIADLEYVVTASEMEAFILEANLIKEHAPPYNIMLKDDKSYPYLLITAEKHPRILVSRTPKQKAGRYYGPYPNVTAAWEAARLLNRLLPLRKCKTLPDKACLYSHIGQCLAPCVNKVPETEYRDILAKAALFLKGEQQEILRWLKEKMRLASEELRFEQAAEFRDLIGELRHLREKQSAALSDERDRDVVAWACNEALLSVQILYYRRGNLIQRGSFLLPYYELPEEAFVSFLMQYYGDNSAAPPEICIPPLAPSPVLEILPLVIPKRGKAADLVRLAQTNAETALSEKERLEEKKAAERESVLAELAVLLSIPAARTIEVFDISNLAGTNVVGGMVQFAGARPNRAAYRKFRLDSHKNPDDTACMREVIHRRYGRLKRENSPFPDLILVDGGRGQIKAALSALRRLELDLPVAGLVKNDRHRTHALLNAAGCEVPLDDRHRDVFRFLEQMQDEAHRFAVAYHRRQRLRQMTLSQLDEIPGIGVARRRLLLTKFGSAEGVAAATEEELRAAGLPPRVARAAWAHFQREDPEAAARADAEP